LGCLLLFSLFPLPEKSLTENRSSSNIYRLSGLLKSSIDKRLSRITLIGVGGAHDAASVERFRQAGADAVVRSLLSLALTIPLIISLYRPAQPRSGGMVWWCFRR
jgi:hypothetical protein